MFQIKKLDLIDLKSIIKNNKYISYKLEKNYLNFRNEYLKSEFINQSFVVKDKNHNSCLAIIFFNQKEKKLDFFGHYCELIYKGKENNYLILKFLENLNIIKKKYNIKNVKFIIREKKLIQNNLFKKYKIHSENREIIVDLNLDEEQILSSFKPSLRNEIKKIYKDVQYKIIDKKKYQNNEIIDMKNINEKLPGLEKRSLSTWLINEKWIQNKEGFLVQINVKDKTIGYSLFYHNEVTCKYFASCIFKEYFNDYKNLQHLALWKAIKYAKSICSNFYVGLVIEWSNDEISQKEINIGKFKSKFSKIPEKSTILIL